MSDILHDEARHKDELQYPKSPSEADAWLGELAELDAVRAAEAVQSSLTALNGAELPARRHVKILEAYRKPVSTIAYRLTDQRVGLSLPLSASVQSHVALTTQMHKLLAAGYARAGVSFANNLNRYDTPMHAMAVHRAITYFSAVCCDAYRVYQQVPNGIWLAIHELIKNAQAHALLRFPVADAFNAFKPQTTITHIYKQILLTAAVDPYKLPHAAVDEIHDRCNNWAVHTLLLSPPFVPKGDCQFLLDLNEDIPARTFKVDQHVGDPRRYLILDTTQLVVALHTRQQALEREAQSRNSNEPSPSERDDLRLLGELIVHWGGTLERKSLRLRADDKRAVMFGFNDVTFHLNREKELAWDEQTPMGIVEQLSGAQCAPATHLNAIDMDWDCIDESSSGVQLTRTSDTPMPVRVGQLVAVRRPIKEKAWDVGVVRWARNDPPETVTMGIYKFGPMAQAAMIQSVDALSKGGTGTPPMLAIGLAMTEGNHIDRSLVAPLGMYAPRNHLVLRIGTRSLLVQPSTLKLATCALEWFTYEIIEELSAEQPQPEQTLQVGTA